MPRPEKVQAVADIKERIEGAQAVFLAEYAGLSVKEQQELRRALREHGAEFKVVKMSMARLAAADLDIDALEELLLGPTGLAFADGDPAGQSPATGDRATIRVGHVAQDRHPVGGDGDGVVLTDVGLSCAGRPEEGVAAVEAGDELAVVGHVRRLAATESCPGGLKSECGRGQEGQAGYAQG